LTAGQRGRSVLLIEHNLRVGRKIEISGGGRCNFTNLGASPENYLSANPNFCRSALARYTPWDFLALVEKHRIAYHEKTLGQQFCDGSSRQIIDMLLAECADGGVSVHCGVKVLEVAKTDRFQLKTDRAEVTCDSLVVATGGLSLPKLGATDFAYRLARRFEHRVTEVRAGLVPLTFPEKDQDLRALSGVSLPVIARCEGALFREAMLITHRGLSGPSILQVSSYWEPGKQVELDLLPDVDTAAILHKGRTARRELAALLAEFWPRRFAEKWVEREAFTKRLADFKNTEIAALAARLHEWPFAPAGTEGYATAEVTLGGIDTTELSSKTMESRKVRGLFFIGEAVDVTGWLGGYNFQWAWASGNAAGQAV
jgi:predicted Rossmann fold flavoprotein